MAKGDVKLKGKTPPARWVFEHFVRPRAKKAKDSDGKDTFVDQWQACLVFPPGTDLEPLKQVCRDVAAEAFGQHWEKLVKQGSIKWPFKDGGDIHPETGEPKFGEGTTFVNVSSNNPVEIVSRYKDPKTGKARLLINKRGEALVDNIEDYIYPGVHGRCSVTVSSFNQESKGITMYVNAAQTLEYGERLANTVSAEEEFADDLEDLPEGEMPEADEDEDASSLL